MNQKKYLESYAQRIRSAYGETYDPLLMFDSQRDVAELLHEDAENRAYRKAQEQTKHEYREKDKRIDYER